MGEPLDNLKGMHLPPQPVLQANITQLKPTAQAFLHSVSYIALCVELQELEMMPPSLVES